MIRYLANLTMGRLILWCYFIWYLAVLVRYFDPSPLLWLTSFGISVIIGIALVISTTTSSKGLTTLEGWQTFRLFLMPFCVSSFAALGERAGVYPDFLPAAAGEFARFWNLPRLLPCRHRAQTADCQGSSINRAESRNF